MNFHTAKVLVFAASVVATLVGCRSQTPATPAAWVYARPIEISNPTQWPLRGLPVRILLDTSNFDFEQAAPNGADLRLTELNGTQPLNYWIERFDATTREAVVWVTVPELAPSATTTLTLHYGNTSAINLSSGRRTFELFDDFGQPGLGYFQFGPPTTIMTRSKVWETQAPHTLSMVEMTPDQSSGFRYWGYYSLADCGGIGIARSNDLVNWQKDDLPLLSQDGERWPSVLKVGKMFYMAHDRDHCAVSQVVLRTSTDGLNFGGKDDYTVLVERETRVRNQNPALFLDPNSGLFYLYWFRGGAEFGVWQIKMRSAPTIEGLANPASEQVLLETPFELAAPNMMVYDNTYFLSTEVNENVWKTTIYTSTSPTGPFTLLPDNPVLSDNQACLFQHIVRDPVRGDVLHGYICKVMGTDWVLNHREALLSKGRSAQRTLDTGIWTVVSGTWQIKAENETKPNPSNLVLQGNGMVQTALLGEDYVFEARAKASAQATWGITVRMQDSSNYEAVRVQAGQVQLEHVVDGKTTIITSTRIPLAPQTNWHTLSLSAAGSQLTVHMNGIPLLQAADALTQTGRSALFAEGGEVMFDNVVWRKVNSDGLKIRIGTQQGSAWKMPELPLSIQP